MASGPWILTNAALTNILTRYLNGGSALTFKCILVTSSSNISDASTTYAGLTGELATGNGYTSGGTPVTLALTGTKALKVQFSGGNPTWTATGGSIGPARRAVLIETGGSVVARSLLKIDVDAVNGDDVTATVGNQISVDSDGTPSPVIEFTTA